MPSSKPRTLSDSPSDGPSNYPLYTLEHGGDELFATWLLSEAVKAVAAWSAYFPTELMVFIQVDKDRQIAMTGEAFLDKLRLDCV